MLGGTWFFRASGSDGKKQAGARAAAARVSCLVRHVYASKRTANVEAEAFGRSGGFRCALVWFWPRRYFRSELASRSAGTVDHNIWYLVPSAFRTTETLRNVRDLIREGYWRPRQQDMTRLRALGCGVPMRDYRDASYGIGRRILPVHLM